MLRDVTTKALHRAGDRRAALGRAIQALEEALASPASEPSWARRVKGSLAALEEAFERHVSETESPGGLLAQVCSDEPRLINATDQIRQEHVEIARDLELAGALVGGAAPTGDVRDELTWICVKLARHRQAGSDLVYEAYMVDIGGTGD